MKREQLLDRIDYDWEAREDIIKKTDGRCARCGVKLKPGKNSTLDHFIPISKGGINQRVNLVPLCEDCNKKKSNKVVGTWWLKFLKKDEQKKLSDYVDSYLKSYEFVTRGNLLSCDMYGINIYIGPELVTRDPKKRKRIVEAASKEFILERVPRKDLGEVKKFYIEYLKKYNILEDENTARKEIEFWNRFGVIYCLRDSKDNIQLIVPILISRGKRKEYYLKMQVFPMKSDPITATVVSEIQGFFSETIKREQKLPYIRSQMLIHSEDKCKRFVPGTETEGYKSHAIIIKDDPLSKEDDTEIPFYENFYDIEKYLDEFFEQDGYEELKYLGETIVEGYLGETIKWARDREA